MFHQQIFLYKLNAREGKLKTLTVVNGFFQFFSLAVLQLLFHTCVFSEIKIRMANKMLVGDGFGNMIIHL